MIDRKAVVARLEALKKDHVQGLAQVNAIAGAVADCEHWLKMIDDADSPDKDKGT